MRNRKVNKITAEELNKAVQVSDSIRAVLQHLGMKINNGNYQAIRGVAKSFDIELPHWDNRLSAQRAVLSNALSSDEVFVDGVYRSGATLKRHLIKLGKTYTCDNEICWLHGKTEWNGEKLTFQVDHVDGNRFNNLITNLRFLCPNCHSQTATFARKNNVRYSYCICGRRMEGDNQNYCVHSQTPKLVSYANKKVRTCADCSKTIWGRSTRCNDCTNKLRVASGSALSIAYPPIEEMVSNIEKMGYLKYSKTLNVSDNAIRKHLRARGVEPLPKKCPRKSSLVSLR